MRYRGYEISKSCGVYWILFQDEVIDSADSPDAAKTVIDSWMNGGS